MIVNSFVTIVSALATQTDLVTVVCTDDVSNDAPMLNELYTFSLPCQTELGIIRIPWVTHRRSSIE
jgi:hypothetical protein